MVIPYRLWHQLTQCLSVFVKTQHFKQGMLLEVSVYIYILYNLSNDVIAVSELSV